MLIIWDYFSSCGAQMVLRCQSKWSTHWHWYIAMTILQAASSRPHNDSLALRACLVKPDSFRSQNWWTSAVGSWVNLLATSLLNFTWRTLLLTLRRPSTFLRQDGHVRTLAECTLTQVHSFCVIIAGTFGSMWINSTLLDFLLSTCTCLARLKQSLSSSSLLCASLVMSRRYWCTVSVMRPSLKVSVRRYVSLWWIVRDWTKWPLRPRYSLCWSIRLWQPGCLEYLHHDLIIVITDWITCHHHHHHHHHQQQQQQQQQQQASTHWLHLTHSR